MSSDLAKLTVPQLKALCKGRRITGYSKLSKAALLQRLAEVATPPNDQASRNATTQVQNPAYIEPSTTQRDGNATQQRIRPSTAGNAQSTDTSTGPAESSQARIVASAASTQKTPSTKRPAHIDVSGSLKRVRTSLKSTVTNTSHEPTAPRAPTLQKQLPDDSAVFKLPELPAQHKKSAHVPPIPANQPSTSKPLAVPCQTADGLARFKPLVVISRPEPMKRDKEPSRAPVVSVAPRATNSSLVFNFHATPPVLSHISFPPKASERKWVSRWAIILSALSPRDRQTCRLVSRTFRYAVYLSAAHLLSRSYPGRRSNTILEQYSKNMTNFWPYLRFRTMEVSERRRAFKQSFLGQYTDAIGYEPLSERLWTSPDDETQVDVALRFVLTRMWFAVSVGTYGHDASKWSKCVVLDVEEIVKDEIWQVIVRDADTGDSCSFYVLEATCEVIGQSLASRGENTLGYRLRADWTAWISLFRQVPLDAGRGSLLECVKWSNTEDYHRGISKAWLTRVQERDTDNVAKRGVADKYILACVVANGISGKWMSTSAMAHEFAGLPDNQQTPSARTAERSMNTVKMYLPSHHHVESVHFTTCKGEALHAAVAVVQTPGREYYVLRDNGMQVGCEEEGIPDVWQQILGCDALGRPC